MYFSALPERGAELTHLFAPPEELIYQGTAPDRAAIHRMRDISQFSDDKVMHMSKKYRSVLLLILFCIFLLTANTEFFPSCVFIAFNGLLRLFLVF